MTLKVLELFGGIGACTKALKRLNIPFEVVDYSIVVNVLEAILTNLLK